MGGGGRARAAEALDQCDEGSGDLVLTGSPLQLQDGLGQLVDPGRRAGFPAGLGAVVPGADGGPTAPATAWLKTTSAGIGLVVIDGVIGVITRFAAGGRARPKIMGRQLISG